MRFVKLVVVGCVGACFAAGKIVLLSFVVRGCCVAKSVVFGCVGAWFAAGKIVVLSYVLYIF